MNIVFIIKTSNIEELYNLSIQNIPMILKERMFRVKPYTKCLDCVRTNHFKCKNCMDQLVNDVIANKQHGLTKHLLRRSPKFKHLYDNKYPVKIDLKPVFYSNNKHSSSVNSMRPSFNQKKNQQFQIHSKYDLWMKHINYKNQENQDTLKSAIKQWPVKKRVYLSTSDMQRHQKKFDRWENKFLERIKNSEHRQAIEKERNAKTAHINLRV